MMERFWNLIWTSIKSERKGEAEDHSATANPALPKIWLLGKAGSGKSSIIKVITGDESIAIGDGYKPCTVETREVRFPRDEPVLRFMDTMGVSGADCEAIGHVNSSASFSEVIVAVARMDDPAQGDLCEAVHGIRNAPSGRSVIVAHSHADAIANAVERDAARALNQRAIERAFGKRLEMVEFSLADATAIECARDSLLDVLETAVPDVAFLIKGEERSNAERRDFDKVRHIVVRFALTAGAAGAVPVVGIPATTGILARMLIRIARCHEIELSREVFFGLASALGSGIFAELAFLKLVRNTGTLIPGIGQTAGVAVAAAGSFASTFAIGRAASYYMFRLKHGEKPSKGEIRNLYNSAFQNARQSYKSTG